MASPTSRSLQRLKRDRWIANVVEKWNAFSHKKNDLFGFIDLLAMRDGELLGVQATSGTNVSARVQKSLASPYLQEWLRTGSMFEVWGWSKRGIRGERKLWSLRRVCFNLLKSGSISIVEVR